MRCQAPLVRPISTIAARVQRISDACEDGELDEEAALMEELEAIEIKMPVVSSVGSGKSRAGAGASAGGGGGGGKEASAQCQQQRKSKGGRAASASAPVSPAEVRKARGASTQATNGRRVSSGMAAKLGSELDSLFQAPGAFNSPLLGKKLASSVRPAPGAAGAFMPGAGNIAAGGAFASFASIPDSRAGGRILQPAPGLDNDPDGRKSAAGEKVVAAAAAAAAAAAVVVVCLVVVCLVVVCLVVVCLVVVCVVLCVVVSVVVCASVPIQWGGGGALSRNQTKRVPSKAGG